jgi:hypothetical protein
MERLPHSKYTKELRLEALRLVTEGGLSVCVGADRPDNTEAVYGEREDPDRLVCSKGWGPL